MEGITRVSVRSKDAKALLPGYITVVVVSACARTSGITEGARRALFCQVAVTLQEDSCHNLLPAFSLLLVITIIPSFKIKYTEIKILK